MEGPNLSFETKKVRAFVPKKRIAGIPSHPAIGLLILWAPVYAGAIVAAQSSFLAPIFSAVFSVSAQTLGIVGLLVWALGVARQFVFGFKFLKMKLEYEWNRLSTLLKIFFSSLPFFQDIPAKTSGAVSQRNHFDSTQ
jgi:hypothetical protein